MTPLMKNHQLQLLHINIYNISYVRFQWISVKLQLWSPAVLAFPASPGLDHPGCGALAEIWGEIKEIPKLPVPWSKKWSCMTPQNGPWQHHIQILPPTCTLLKLRQTDSKRHKLIQIQSKSIKFI